MVSRSMAARPTTKHRLTGNRVRRGREKEEAAMGSRLAHQRHCQYGSRTQEQEAFARVRILGVQQWKNVRVVDRPPVESGATREDRSLEGDLASRLRQPL